MSEDSVLSLEEAEEIWEKHLSIGEKSEMFQELLKKGKISFIDYGLGVNRHFERLRHLTKSSIAKKIEENEPLSVAFAHSKIRETT